MAAEVPASLEESSMMVTAMRPRSASLQRTGNYPLQFRSKSSEALNELMAAGDQDIVQKRDKFTPAIAFDIDGVFKHGGKWEAEGAQALRKVMEAEVPFVFMTNGGGGRTETQYVGEIADKLVAAESETKETPSPPLSIPDDKIILSYTPYNFDLAHLKDKPVLVVGDPVDKVMNVARSYGFEKAIHIVDYDRSHPLMNPFKWENTAVDTSEESWEEGLQAVLVFTDPGHFFMALQIIIDVLLSSRPGEKEFEADFNIPIFFSNPDLLWKTQFPYGRFGQGAFRLALQSLYVARLHSLGVTDEDVEQRLKNWVQYGKPEIAQYKFTVRRLEEQAGDRQIAHFYMVGDNPHSDMQGCINMNKLVNTGGSRAPQVHWSGVLVRTGVFSDGDDPNEAAAVVDNVHDAVDWILAQHGLGSE